MEFKTGDVVRLKSGGQKMTVDNPLPFHLDERVHCHWFERDRLKSGNFSPDALIKVEEEDGSTEQPASGAKPRKKKGAVK